MQQTQELRSNFPTFISCCKPNSDDQKNKRDILTGIKKNFATKFGTFDISAIPESLSIHFKDNSIGNKTIQQNQYKQTTVKKKLSNDHKQIQPQPQTPLFIFPTSYQKLNEQGQSKQKISCKLAKSHLLDNKLNQDRCYNHQENLGTCEMCRDERIGNYCQKCATKLVSQRFQNHKNKRNQINKAQAYNSNIQSIETFGNQKRKKCSWQQQLENCLQDMNSIRETHLTIINQCKKVEKVYIEQIDILQTFYSSLLDIVNHYKNEHLKGLKSQCAFLVQQFHRQIAYLSKAVRDIDDLSNDIRVNMSEILASKNQAIFKSCISYYYQTAFILAKKANSIDKQTKMLPNYSPYQLQQSISLLQNKIHAIISSQTNRTKSLYTCIKPIKLKTKQFSKKKNSEGSRKIFQQKHRRSCTYIYQKQNSKVKNNQQSTIQIQKIRQLQNKDDIFRTKSLKRIQDYNFSKKFFYLEGRKANQ